MNTQSNLQRWERYAEWPLAAAALLFLGLFSVQALARPHGCEAYVLWVISWIVWGLFIVDYVVRLYLASNRSHWFVRHQLDFAIVALPLVRPLRLLRLLVLIEVLQKAIGNAFRDRIVVYTVSGVLLLIYTSSLAVFDKERFLPGATINSFGKALWWSITTVTTVGYGDVYPVTNTGRIIAVLLMIGGISLVGVVTAALASWIIERVSEEETVIDNGNRCPIIEELRGEIRELSQELQGKSATMTIAPETFTTSGVGGTRIVSDGRAIGSSCRGVPARRSADPPLVGPGCGGRCSATAGRPSRSTSGPWRVGLVRTRRLSAVGAFALDVEEVLHNVPPQPVLVGLPWAVSRQCFWRASFRPASPAPWCSSTSSRTWIRPGRTEYTTLCRTG